MTHSPLTHRKPLQALPLLETGAADALRLSEKEMSLACASHNGEPIHVDTVLQWLEKINLSDDDLECGAHLPRRPEVLSAFVESGVDLKQAHNNCSGKHTSMLSHAMHLGEDPKGYIEYDHPVQERVRAALEDMYGYALSDAAWGRDGCSIPTMAVPTRCMAQAMAKFTNPEGLAPARAEACARISAAIMAEPYMIAGGGRCCTTIMAAAPGKLVAKTGAEGVYMAGLPGRNIGIALKARDGTGRATETALLHVLNGLGIFSDHAMQSIDGFLNPSLRNVNGFAVGEMRAVPWSDKAAF